MPQILEWLQDMNWPVARVFRPFLANAGVGLVPFIRAIFESNDNVWKYNILVEVVGQSPELAIALRVEIERMENTPTSGERLEGVPVEAQEILAN